MLIILTAVIYCDELASNGFKSKPGTNFLLFFWTIDMFPRHFVLKFTNYGCIYTLLWGVNDSSSKYTELAQQNCTNGFKSKPGANFLIFLIFLSVLDLKVANF